MRLWIIAVPGVVIFLLGLFSGRFYYIINLLWIIYSLAVLGLIIFWVKAQNRKMESILSDRPETNLINEIFPIYISDLARAEQQLLKIYRKIEAIEYNLLNQKARQAGESLDLMLKATTDPLTGVPNREHLNTHLGKVFGKVAPLSLVMADIDHFKKINDTYGHDAGDVVLKKFAQLVRGSIRPSDYLFRYGGEEFIIVANTDLKETAEIIERVRKEVANSPININETDTVNITASFGVAGYRPGDTQENLLKRADEALYRAKQGGRNRVCQEDNKR